MMVGDEELAVVGTAVGEAVGDDDGVNVFRNHSTFTVSTTGM